MKRIGRYEVVRELRGGGMGTVTLGKSPGGQLVVLKRPHSVDLDAAVRLRDEARIGARLLHPSIVDTLDLFELESGVPVLVVAYVDGPSLEVLRPLGPLPTGVIARLGRQIAEGLAALHEACDENGRPLHILHRDVTPGNIVVAKDGDAKLIDLGIARFSERQAEHTQDGFLRGTMRYLAPELLQGDTYSAASDLWALGMVLWEAALGRFAYRGETDREVLAGILRGEPMELDEGEHVDEEIARVIRPLLHPSPALRVRSGAEAAAWFAALEERCGDTATLTRDAIADALARKTQRDAEQKARIADMLLPENLGFPTPRLGAVGDELFADEETAAETERYRGPAPVSVAGPFDALPPTGSLTADEVPKPRFVEHGEKTVNVPAPVSFLVAPLEEPAPDDAAPPSAGEDELDATTPMPTLPVPPEALRSDDDDLPVRARAFESGEVMPPPTAAAPPPATEAPDDDDDSPTMVTPIPAEVAARRKAERAAAPSPPPSPWPTLIATAAPAPQLDEDDLDEARTLGGLSPARPTPSKVVMPAPAPAPPSVDVSQPIARIALTRKTAAQIEEERAAKQRASIDALPAAKPKKARTPEPVVARAEHVDDGATLSPFEPGSGAEEAAAAKAPDVVVPSSDATSSGKGGRGRRKKRAAKGKRAKKAAPPVDEPAAQARAAETDDELSSIERAAAEVAAELAAELAAEVEGRPPAAPPREPPEAPEPTQVSPPPAHPLPSSLFGARIVELPPPQPPVQPSSFSARAEPHAAVPLAEPPPEEPRADPPQPRAAGEVMKLNDVVAFLEDD